jgi:hypothetical protein
VAQVLAALGGEIRPPGWDAAEWPTSWLVWAAFTVALGGLGVSALVGQHLVGLEVGARFISILLHLRVHCMIVAWSHGSRPSPENQRVEARLRTDLVVLEEQGPAALAARVAEGRPHFDTGEFWRNYRRLYANFAALSLWLTAYVQTMGIFPFLIAAPRLFAQDPATRITLGAAATPPRTRCGIPERSSSHTQCRASAPRHARAAVLRLRPHLRLDQRPLHLVARRQRVALGCPEAATVRAAGLRHGRRRTRKRAGSQRWQRRATLTAANTFA